MTYRNREDRNAAQRRWLARHRDWQKARNRAYYAANRERLLAQAKIYGQTHKVAVKVRNRAYYLKHKTRHLAVAEATRLRRQYGLTRELVDAMTEAQGGLCAICRKPKKLVVDHDHKTGAVRALLCDGCNHGLHFIENTEFAVAAAAYLRRHQRASA